MNPLPPYRSAIILYPDERLLYLESVSRIPLRARLTLKLFVGKRFPGTPYIFVDPAITRYVRLIKEEIAGYQRLLQDYALMGEDFDPDEIVPLVNFLEDNEDYQVEPLPLLDPDA